MDKTPFEVFESEVKRLEGRMGRRDEGRRLKDGASLAVSTAQSRSAVQKFAAGIVSDPKRLANFQVSAAGRDPVLLAAIAGPRAMANLSGVAVADGRKPDILEKIAAKAARDHLELASKNPALAARREAQWQSQRKVMSRGFMAGALREVSDTYVRSVSQTISAGQNGRASVAPVPGWRPEGAFRSMATLSPQMAAVQGPVQAQSRVPKEFRDNPVLNRSFARAALAAQLADSRAGVAGSAVGFRQAFRKYYAASVDAVTRATNRVGAGLDAAASRARRGREAVVSGARAGRDGVRDGARAAGRSVAAGGRAVRDGSAAGGRAVRDGAAAGGRAVRDGVAAGSREVRDRAAAGGRVVRDGLTAGGRAVKAGGARAVGAGVAAGGQAIDRFDRFMERTERKAAALVVGGAVAARLGVVNMVSRAATNIASAASRVVGNAVTNPVAMARFQKQLKSHMQEGPEATKSFLSKTLSSKSGRSVAMKAGLDKMTIAAALGPKDLETGLRGHPLFGVVVNRDPGAEELYRRGGSRVALSSLSRGRAAGLGLGAESASLAASEVDLLRAFGDCAQSRDERCLDARGQLVGGTRTLRNHFVDPNLASLTRSGPPSSPLQDDPEFRDLREELCARSAGYSSGSDCPDMKFAEHAQEVRDISNNDFVLECARDGKLFDSDREGVLKLVRDNRLPDRDLNQSTLLELEKTRDSVMEGGRNAKLVRDARADEFDDSRRSALSVLDDDWASGRRGEGLEPVAGEDKRSPVPTPMQRQFAAERVADLRLALSPAAQADARENGIDSVNPRNASDRVVLRDIEICRETISDYEQSKGNPDYARDKARDKRSAPASERSDRASRSAADAPAAPSTPASREGVPAASAPPAEKGRAANAARPAEPPRAARSDPAPAVASPASAASPDVVASPAAKPSAGPPRAAAPEPQKPVAGRSAASPAAPEPEKAARAAAAASKPAPAPAQAARGHAAGEPKVGDQPARAGGRAAKSAPAPAQPARANAPSNPKVEKKLASAIVLRVAGKERRAANVIKQVVRNHADHFTTDAARQKVCQGAEKHARAVLKGRKLPEGANLSLDPSRLQAPRAQQRTSASPAARGAASAGRASSQSGQRKPAAAAARKAVQPAKRVSGGPSAPGGAAGSRASRAASGGRDAAASGDSPAFAPPNRAAFKRGGASDRAPVARPSVAGAPAPPAPAKDKGQDRPAAASQR